MTKSVATSRESSTATGGDISINLNKKTSERRIRQFRAYAGLWIDGGEVVLYDLIEE